MTTLGFERGSSATTSHRRFEKELDAIIDERPRERHASTIRPCARAWRRQWSKIQIMRINGYRTLTAAVQGKQGPRRRRARRDQQDVLVRDAPRHDEPRDGHPRSVRADPHRQGHRRGRVRPGLRPPPRARRLSGVDRCRRRSSSRGPRRSGAAPPRSSATSSASGCSGCRRSPSLVEPSRGTRRAVGAARDAATRAGAIDLVPITFAFVDDDTIVTAVDHKPKRTTRLQRLDNIRARAGGDGARRPLRRRLVDAVVGAASRGTADRRSTSPTTALLGAARSRSTRSTATCRRHGPAIVITVDDVTRLVGRG